MQNAECRMQNESQINEPSSFLQIAQMGFVLHSAFCLLHSAFLFPSAFLGFRTILRNNAQFLTLRIRHRVAEPSYGSPGTE
jgi:hypothetical protein